MGDSKRKGDLAEAKFLAALLACGEYRVSIPWGDNYPYDLVLEVKGIFTKVQVKTGNYIPHKGTIIFSTRKTYRNAGKVLKQNYSVDEIDYFGVYCPQLDKCYLVPFSLAGKGSGTLRVYGPLNNQTKGIRFAKDYYLAPIA